ncbi:MAG: DUF3108 domain-containing protein [Pyrinomonadaceae bacterium]|nr:DUF3108 domain-containing protein [Blastocatellia bacterium]MDQ3220601.1 DUF3108 domain-containing protein [Acidobacteriota bacterium]
MKPLLFKLFAIFVVTAAFAAMLSAQANGGNRSKAMPFANGETLTYEGKISRIVRGIAVADMTFTLLQPSKTENYIVKGDARSKGTFLKLFRFSFSQQLQSTISNREFRILKTVKHDVQKDRVRDSEALFDYQQERVTYIETNPEEPMRPPRKIASEIEETTHDMISGIYSLRMLPLAVGKTFDLTISDSGLVYKIPVKVTAREQQKTILGNVWCLRVEPDVFGRNRLIEKEGSMIIWMTDDARKIPVRSQINSPVGRIEIKLKTAKNLK